MHSRFVPSKSKGPFSRPVAVNDPSVAWMPRVEYLGESLGLSALQDERNDMDVYHPLSLGSSSSVPCGLDTLQLAILAQQGAFLLPDTELCDELVDGFFQHVAPVLPVVDKTSFLSQYRNEKESGHLSLLLLQAVLLAASKMSKSPRLWQIAGSNSMSASECFYKRAKALYDAEYESDRVIVLQSLSLIGWYCEDPRGITAAPEVSEANLIAVGVGTTFYWSRIAIAVAQSIGIH